MLNWINVIDTLKPQVGRVVICYCPGWCESGYQVAFWNGREFYYDEQPNEEFNSCVNQWAIFYEAD